MIRDLQTEDVRAGLEDGSITLVDVREPQELMGGVIPGALAMPLSSFQPEALPRGRVVFSCAAGVRSRIALQRAQEAGLPFDEHYVGGFKGWVSAGLPVARWEPA